MTAFKKVIDFPHWQVYSVECDDVKLPKDYQFIYHDFVDNRSQIIVKNSDDWDMEVFMENSGFLFCKPNAKIPKFRREVEYGCSSIVRAKNLKELFMFDNSKTIALEFEPKENASPRIRGASAATFTEQDFIDCDPYRLFSKLVETNDISSPKEWYEHVKSYCPPVIYQKTISAGDFKRALSFKDYYINYDIRTANDIEILLKIEEKFLDFDTEIKVYEDITRKYDIVKEYCSKNKIQHSTGENEGIKFITLKYNDFMKINLKASISHLLC